MSNPQKTKRRAALFVQQSGLCHWCGCAMSFPAVYPKLDKGQKLPVDLCTLDHLRDRFDPLRRKQGRGEQRYVAACWQCNNDRGRDTCLRNRAKGCFDKSQTA